MLEVIFYQTTEDLSVGESKANPLIVCPSPLVADGLRRLMPKNSEVITISKWVSDYLKTKNLKRSNKAELMLRLSSVWRHYFPEGEAHQFFKSFEMFTDLRSFSLSLDMLSEFLKEVDEVTTKSIFIFWGFLQNEKLIDEHLSYQLLAENENSDENSNEARPLWIIGFKHLSGIQIDMLKVISEKRSVAVFFPKDVYAETMSTDWIRWLIPEEKVVVSDRFKELKVIYYPKNKLNIVLESVKKMIPHFDVAMACQNVTFNLRQEVALENLFFKSQEDLFRVQRDFLMDDFKEHFQDELKNAPILLADFVLKIEEKKKNALSSEQFLLYKTLLLLEEAVNAYGEFQETVDLFTLKVLKMILELNSPRVSLATMIKNPEGRLLELNELPYLESVRPLVVIASSNYGPLKSGEGHYSEKMIDALKVIAPLKRSGLDFLYLKNELAQTLSHEGNILLMEEGLELVDLSWREILKGFELLVVNSNADYQLKVKKDYLKSKVLPGPYIASHVSASRLQLFIDCPRKYYFSYVDKVDHRPMERLKIAPDEMGTIEHIVIEKFFSNKTIDASLFYDEAIHFEQCQVALEDFIIINKIILNEKMKLSTIYELFNYTRNGIEFLIQFCQQHDASSIEFEFALGENPWGLVGSIDCLIQLKNNKYAMIDFKRSAMAIGSKKETMAFDKIQIWVYLLILLKQQGKIIHSWGYLNLSEIEASLLYHEEVTPLLSTGIVDDFQNLLQKTIVALSEEVHFLANPRTSKVCGFCEMELFCSKGNCS